MGYSNLIDANLNRAYNLAKDLAVEVTFVHKAGTSFSFATGVVSHATSTSVQVKVIILDTKRETGATNVLLKELMFKSRDLQDVSSYDKVIINGETWDVGASSKDDGRIKLIRISKVA